MGASLRIICLLVVGLVLAFEHTDAGWYDIGDQGKTCSMTETVIQLTENCTAKASRKKDHDKIWWITYNDLIDALKRNNRKIKNIKQKLIKKDATLKKLKEELKSLESGNADLYHYDIIEIKKKIAKLADEITDLEEELRKLRLERDELLKKLLVVEKRLGIITTIEVKKKCSLNLLEYIIGRCFLAFSENVGSYEVVFRNEKGEVIPNPGKKGNGLLAPEDQLALSPPTDSSTMDVSVYRDSDSEEMAYAFYCYACEENPCRCYIQDEPLYVPYDGGSYGGLPRYIVSSGNYQFTQIQNPGDDCFISVTADVEFEAPDKPLVVKKAGINFKGSKFELNHDGTNEGVTAQQGYSVTQAGAYTVVEFDECDVSITFKCTGANCRLAVTASPDLAPMGPGMCGDCDGVPEKLLDSDGNDVHHDEDKYQEAQEVFLIQD